MGLYMNIFGYTGEGTTGIHSRIVQKHDWCSFYSFFFYFPYISRTWENLSRYENLLMIKVFCGIKSDQREEIMEFPLSDTGI